MDLLALQTWRVPLRILIFNNKNKYINKQHNTGNQLHKCGNLGFGNSQVNGKCIVNIRIRVRVRKQLVDPYHLTSLFNSYLTLCTCTCKNNPFSHCKY